MQIELLGVNQKIDFKTRAIVNMLCLRLPVAGDIEVAVDDAVAQKVLNAFFKGRGAEVEDDAPLPAPAPLPNGTSHHALVEAVAAGEEDAPFVFGGEESAVSGPVALSSEVPPPPPPPKGPRRGPQVAKDSMGYPVIHGGVNAASLVGEDDPDEDGVGSA